MRIAITGGSGLVGRAVTTLALEQGHHVVSIDRVPPAQDAVQGDVTYTQAEVTEYPMFEQAVRSCDALVHLAAIPSPRGHADYAVHNNNVVASYNALCAAAHVGITRVCQASSINATGGFYSRWPRYDYFPVDEQHPTYNEDAYSLSKWVCEQQADSFARRYEAMTIASLRLHGLRPTGFSSMLSPTDRNKMLAKQLWGYTRLQAAAGACLRALTAPVTGHEVFYIVAPDTMMDTPSIELAEQFFPDVPVRGDLSGNRSFYTTAKAERLLGWNHDDEEME